MLPLHVKDVIRLLPKVDLHVHLDGSIKPRTLLELAHTQGVELPEREPDKLVPYMQAEADCSSLEEYLSKFAFVLEFLQTPEALERAAYEVLEQAKANNCHYIEVRLGTNLHLNRGLSLDEVHEAFLSGLKKGERDFGIKARGIAICLRHHPVSANKKVIESALRFRDKGMAAVDLAGPEAGFPPALQREVFALARSHGMPVTIHAGEAAGADSVRDAVELLGADRIGHGVRMKEDPSVVEMIRERRIPLEMCPVSNIQTKAAADWRTYPIREYVRQGIIVTVNTDNLTVSGTDINREYDVLAEQFGFSAEDICRLILNGVDSAFLEKSEKEKLRKQFLREFKAMNLFE